MNKKIMLVTGEASGEQHAVSLVKALKKIQPKLEFIGLGGELLAAEGVKITYNLVSHAVIGIFEAIRKLGDFFQALKEAERLLHQQRPQVLILIDFPDMNFKIAAKAKALGIPIVYYISPQVWAWRSGRIKTIKRLVDKMLVILPFEEEIYQLAGVPVKFVGHPLMDIVKPEEALDIARSRLLGKTQGPLIALVPGSRQQEIELLLPTMLETAKLILKQIPSAKFFVPLAKTISREQVEEVVNQAKLEVAILSDKLYAARAAADLAIVSSGTATLETAILKVPMLIVYKMNMLSYYLAKMFVKLDCFGLANLVAGKKIAPEFLQTEFRADKVAEEVFSLLGNPERTEYQKGNWERVCLELGGKGAAERAAQEILHMIG